MAALLVAFVLQVPFARGTSVLQPLSVKRPDEAVFPLPEAPRHLPPFGTEVTGAKATNKFWANWVVEEGRELSIHPMPYVLRYDESTGSPNMRISRSSSDERVVQYGDAETNGAEKIRYYFSPFVSEFGLGAIEGAGNDGQVVVKEGLFGIHTEVRGPVGSGRKIVFPIYSGMSYVSGLYSGFTPKITSDRALLVIERVSNGIWRLLNNGGKELLVLSFVCMQSIPPETLPMRPLIFIQMEGCHQLSRVGFVWQKLKPLKIEPFLTFMLLQSWSTGSWMLSMVEP
eukprot:symbB.v1.2.018524.t1/scaffold1481.1/size116218/3